MPARRPSRVARLCPPRAASCAPPIASPVDVAARLARVEAVAEREIEALLAQPDFQELVAALAEMAELPEEERLRQLERMAWCVLEMALADSDGGPPPSSPTRCAAAATPPARWPRPCSRPRPAPPPRRPPNPSPPGSTGPAPTTPSTPPWAAPPLGLRAILGLEAALRPSAEAEGSRAQRGAPSRERAARQAPPRHRPDRPAPAPPPPPARAIPAESHPRSPSRAWAQAP